MGSFSSYSEAENARAARRQWYVVCLVLILALSGFGLGYSARAHVAGGAHILRARPDLSAYHSAGNVVDVGTRSDEDIRPLQTMIEALRQVRHFYVERIEDSEEKNLTYSSLAKMMESLGDPQSRFLVPEQRELTDDALAGKFHGIGAVLGFRKEKTEHGLEGRLVVVSALPGSPAEKAGLLPGDSIREKDGKWIISYNPIDSAMEMLKGVRNHQINPIELQKALESAKKKLENGITIQKAADELTKRDTGKFALVVIRRKDPKPIKMTITPAVTRVAAVDHKVLDASTGYIHINYFGQATPDAFAEALADLRAGKVTKLVLDLRNSPGGSTDAALRVAGWLEPKKPFAVVARSHGPRQSVNTPDSEKAASDKLKPATETVNRHEQIVTLVNGGTSNAAETLAASLHDNGVALLVGSPTYGDFLQHTMFVLRDGSAVTFTTGKFLTPKGADLDEKGLAVDVAVASSTTGDAQLQKAIEVLRTKAGS